ncbi:chitobiase/beta-hexosaminidase C-terminal domain-containing protein [Peribacillus simplex]|uniref:chitobiase/beta-hexosaminidase C-terminal domain-containing protein n=1 Tax=Peribacillus simplex TaxID=1478 RepID=UPI002E23A962|nr:chitobiase/beta-hexosaminidase C-terminal domain-containing protein [Peribacillus simplex]
MGGFFNNNKGNKGNDATSISGLSDVDLTTVAPSEGYVLSYINGLWKPKAIPTGGTAPSNVILFEDWTGGESVTIATGTPLPDTTAPILTITPNGGTFATSQNVTMAANETAEIFYTTDGTTPTISSTKYTSAINLSDTTTIKTIAKDTAGNISTVKTVTFTKDVAAPADTTVPVLTISPGAGTFVTSQSVTMTTNETAEIFYTTDGTTPTTASPKYSAPVTVSATTTVKAFAKDTAGNNSAVQTAVYTKDAGNPTGYVNDASLLLKADNPTVTPYAFANKDLYFNDTDQFTYGVTFKPVADTNAALRLAYRQSPNAIKFEFTFDNKITATLTGKLANGTGSASYPNISPTTVYPVDGSYYHAVIMRTATQLEMYMNDIKVGSVSVPADFKVDESTSELTIGVAGEVGQVKNVVYYNRILTTAELTQNYNALK